MNLQWRTRLRPCLGLLAACLSGAGWCAMPAWTLGGEGGLGFDSNLGNATAQADVLDGGFASAAAHAAYSHPLSLFTGALARFGVQGESYADFDELSNAKASLLLRLSHRPGGGFYTPVLSAWVSAAQAEFGSRIRDGAELRGGAALQAQLTTAVSARLSLSLARRSADGRVFDLDSQAAALDLDWRLAPRLALYGGYRYIAGDLVSSARVAGGGPPGPGAGGIAAVAEAAAADDAFGADWYAYRLDAQTEVASLGLNYAWSPRLSLDAQVQHANAESERYRGYDYARTISLVSLLLRL